MLDLKIEKGSFKDDKTGEVIDYLKYYVDFNGIKVYLKPADSTGKQILEHIFKQS